MNRYRVYKLDGPKGRIVKGKDVFADNDPEAMQEAVADEDCPICEVWQGTKKVGEIE